MVAPAGAAAHGEVAGGDDDLAAVDEAHPLDPTLRHQPGEVAVLVVVATAAQAAELTERTGVGEQRDALAHGQLAARVLAGDAILATHLLDEAAALGQFVDFRLPAHDGTRGAAIAPFVATASRRTVHGSPVASGPGRSGAIASASVTSTLIARPMAATQAAKAVKPVSGSGYAIGTGCGRPFHIPSPAAACTPRP